MQRFTTAIIAFFIIGIISSAEAGQDRPRALRGVLDLSAQDLSVEAASLDGEWSFRWKDSADPSADREQFMQVPSSWTSAGHPADGYATYSLRVVTPYTGVIGIRMPTAA